MAYPIDSSNYTWIAKIDSLSVLIFIGRTHIRFPKLDILQTAVLNYPCVLVTDGVMSYRDCLLFLPSVPNMARLASQNASLFMYNYVISFFKSHEMIRLAESSKLQGEQL